MDQKARQALNIIRKCVSDRGDLTRKHFTGRMDERGLFWADIRMVLSNPEKEAKTRGVIIPTQGG